MGRKKGEKLKNDIINGELYNELSNDLANTLPTLKAPNNEKFWGNENPSVSTILLTSIAAIYKIKNINLTGAATFYPFFSDKLKLLNTENYPFASEEKVILFGDYQYGGHRYFSNKHPNLGQKLFAPEDCSSAIGKATNLTTQQVLSINTSKLIKAYFNDNNDFGYMPVTSTNKKEINLNKIEPGDIYVKEGHTAIIASKPDTHKIVECFEFNRNLDIKEHKFSGGGSCKYQLLDKPTKDIYILRSKASELKESCPLSEFINQIDLVYANTDQINNEFFVDFVGNDDNFNTINQLRTGEDLLNIFNA